MQRFSFLAGQTSRRLAPPRALVRNCDLNTYSHLFPDAMGRVVEGLEEIYREAETGCRRPELDARVLDLKSPGATHAL